jgi:hypothetical protein
MAFPTSPSNNQIALVNGIEYYYNSTKGAWYRYGDATANVITSNTFQVLSSITFADGTSQTTAGVAVDSYARTTANTASNNIVILQGVDTTQNTQIAGIQGVDLAQNSSISIIQGVDLTQNTNITSVNQYAASAYNKANTGGIFTGDVTIQQNLVVSGNVTITGNIISEGAENLVINDPLIYLANNNTGNTVDIGVVGNFTGGSPSIYQHTGFVRDATDGTWKLFSNVVAEPTTTVDFTYAVYDNLKVGAVTGNIIATTAVINGVDFTASQATQNTNITSVNQYAASAYAAANTNTSDIAVIQGVNTTQNTNITAVNNYAASAYGAANTNATNITLVNQYAASAYAQANTNATNISIMQGVNTTQNTNISYADAKAQAAFDKANTGTSGGGSVLTSTVDPFTGNGSQTAFTLSVTPSSINYTTAVVGGVNQPKTAYSVVGTTLTFSSAPANGQLIEVTTLTTSNSDIYTVNNIISPFLLMGA